MPYRAQEYMERVRSAILTFQMENLISDRELSQKAGLSPSMISKIKSGKTLPKLSTLRKLRDIGVDIPRPPDTLVAKERAAVQQKVVSE